MCSKMLDVDFYEPMEMAPLENPEDSDFLALFEQVHVTRKRKITQIDESSSSVYFVAFDDYTDSAFPSKSLKFGETFDSKLGRRLGDDRDFVIFLTKYFSNDDLRSFCSVSKMWCDAVKYRLQVRSGTHPSVLLWKSGVHFEEFKIDEFVNSIECGPQPMQAVFFTATEYMENVSLPFGTRDFLPGITCAVGFSKKLIATTPDFRLTMEIGSPMNAFQALCIPRSERLLIKGFSMPVWGTSADNWLYEKVEVDILISKLIEAWKAPTGYTLKGLSLMLYNDDFAIKNLILSRMSSENKMVPLIGGVLENIVSSEIILNNSGIPSSPTVACGWAFFGTDQVRISSLALEVAGVPHLPILYDHIRQHFQGASDGFIISFFKKESTQCKKIIELLRQNVPAAIPIVGLQSDHRLYFEGSLILGANPTFLSFSNVNPLVDVKMVCLIVAY